MIIKALTIENFKAIGEPIRVEFKPITLLFGPNSAGKSTIVQAINYTREMLERNNLDVDRTAGTDESFNLGGFKNIVHKHNVNLPIKLKYELYFSPPNNLYDFFEGRIDNAWIEFEIKWSNFLNAPLVISSQVGVDGEYFAKIVCDEDGKRARITEINFNHHLLGKTGFLIEGSNVSPAYLMHKLSSLIKEEFIFPGRLFDLYIDQETALPLNIKIKDELLEPEEEMYRRDERDAQSHALYEPTPWEDLNEFFETYFLGLSSLLRDELKKFRYIGPIRKTPSRLFEPVRTEVESRWTSGLAAWDVLNKVDDDFIQRTNNWLSNKNRLSSGYKLVVKKYKELETSSPTWYSLTSKEFPVNGEEVIEEIMRFPEKRRIFLRDEMNGIEVLPQDVGIGISQVLPIIVLALHSKGGIIAIEQPELHIHPAFQVAIGDLFISQAKEQDIGFLIETHSEHLLLRLMRRVRETTDAELPPNAPELNPDDIGIHYIEQTTKGMQISMIHVDKEGDFIDKWPRGFFPERFEELY
jgi:predicted ATPase